MCGPGPILWIVASPVGPVSPGCGPDALDCHFAPLGLRARGAGLVRWTVASPSWAWEPGMRA